MNRLLTGTDMGIGASREFFQRERDTITGTDCCEGADEPVTSWELGDA